MFLLVNQCVCVSVKKHLGTRWNGFSTILQQGGNACLTVHCPTKTLSVHGDMEKRRLFHVPAIQVELLEKLLHFRVSAFQIHFSIHFRCVFDHLPIQIRRPSDSFTLGLNSTLTNLRTTFTTMTTHYARTMLEVKCFNRGLWDNPSLPRTTPDKHVELSSVCVSFPGATSSRLDGPSEKAQVRKPQLMFPNRTREAFVPWIKGRTAGPLSHYSQSGTRI